jgi:hypothetical protein
VFEPQRLLAIVREHWGIENRLHWLLDVVMEEDADRTRKDNGPANLAILRRLALNILRANPDTTPIRRKINAPAGSPPSSSPSSPICDSPAFPRGGVPFGATAVSPPSWFDGRVASAALLTMRASLALEEVARVARERLLAAAGVGS